jgi:hypothetical protein
MEMLRYLLLANLLLLVFYAFYYAFLRRETFFMLNRIYLIGSAFLSVIIPLINWTWLNQLFADAVQMPKPGLLTLEKYLVIQARDTNPAELALNWNFTDILLGIYLLGVWYHSGRLIWQIAVLKTSLQDNAQSSAFSFFNKIVIDEQLPEQQTILHHELVHVRQWHSADVIFFKLLRIFNWFNPITLAYQNAITEIHEYIADEASVLHTDKFNYVSTLLSHTFDIPAQQLTNNFFYEPLIKKRIIMLSKPKSGKKSLLKYGLALPLCLVAVVLFSASGVSKSKIDKQATLANAESNDQSPFSDLAKHFTKTVIYPQKAKEDKTVGKVAATFKINKGKISAIQVTHSAGNELDKEVVRCLNSYTQEIDVIDNTYTLIAGFELQNINDKENGLLKAPAINTENLSNVLNELIIRAYYK